MFCCFARETKTESSDLKSLDLILVRAGAEKDAIRLVKGQLSFLAIHVDPGFDPLRLADSQYHRYFCIGAIFTSSERT